jgi:isoquinoline 1-oxidoreductase alpha subunit
MALKLFLNGSERKVDVAPEKPLLWVLREDLGLLGTKFGCGTGLCGACTVHVDGVAKRSCLLPLSQVAEKSVVTIEGISAADESRRLKAAWISLDVPQCGYCQAGQIMSACALLRRTPQPSDRDIDEAMSGNLCRCCTYPRIRAAIKSASGGA